MWKATVAGDKTGRIEPDGGYNVRWSSFFIYSGRKETRVNYSKNGICFQREITWARWHSVQFSKFSKLQFQWILHYKQNCTSHCEVIVTEKESLQTPWPLRKLSRLYQHDICKYWGVICTHRGKNFSCFYSAWLSKRKRQICMMGVYCAMLSSMQCPYWLPSKDNALLDSLIALLVISRIIVNKRCRIWHNILDSRNRKFWVWVTTFFCLLCQKEADIWGCWSLGLFTNQFCTCFYFAIWHLSALKLKQSLLLWYELLPISESHKLI